MIWMIFYLSLSYRRQNVLKSVLIKNKKSQHQSYKCTAFPSFLYYWQHYQSRGTICLKAEQWHYSSLWYINDNKRLIPKLMLCSNMHQTASHITQSAEQWIAVTNKLIASKILQHIKVWTEHRNPVTRNRDVTNLKGDCTSSCSAQPSTDH